MREEALEIYKKAVKELCPQMTEQELEYFRNELEVIKLPAKHFFIQAGTVQRQLGFVAKGLIRSFYIDEAGQEVTTYFAKEGQYATDYPAFIKQMPTFSYFQCLEETTLVLLSYEHMQSGYDEFLIFNRYGRLMAEQVITMMQTRIRSLQFQSAEERYLDFLGTDPNLFNRISLTHLASYLGIDRSSLSRIRKKITP